MSGSDTPRSRRELVSDVLRALTPAQERRMLLELVKAELLAADIYAMAAVAEPISPAGQNLARRLGNQERAHLNALAMLMSQSFGATLSPSQAEKALATHGIPVRFDELHTERQWFTLLEQLEGVLEGLYFRALGRLSDPGHALLAARILASEAQHSTLLLSFRNPNNIQLDVAEGQIKGRAH
ncbi:MAG TPA: ferritin-like domain-containing protein [Solirubrobacteraceae bacterium]|jgi:hypothetical protein|nr:ferritin-like domain-containing protein [Solirubrobacteraceae bacterium]